MDDIDMAQMAKSPYVDSLPFPQTAHVLTVRSTKQHKHQKKNVRKLWARAHQLHNPGQ